MQIDLCRLKKSQEGQAAKLLVITSVTEQVEKGNRARGMAQWYSTCMVCI